MTRVEEHLHMVGKSVKRFVAQRPFLQTQFDDLYQEASIGLLHADRTYDANKGASFATHAYHCIEFAMLNYQERVHNRHTSPIADEADDAGPMYSYPDPGPSPETLAAGREAFRQLPKALIAKRSRYCRRPYTALDLVRDHRNAHFFADRILNPERRSEDETNVLRTLFGTASKNISNAERDCSRRFEKWAASIRAELEAA